MMSGVLPTPLSSLKRFANSRIEERPKCELCSALIGDVHDHLLDPRKRSLSCACPSCSLLFPAGAGAAYRRIVRHSTRLVGTALDDGDWDALGVPVRLVFLVPSEVHGRVFALYPNAAGLVEAHVPTSAWNLLVERHPELHRVRPETDAAVLDGLSAEGRVYHVSIDVCHEWLGVLRRERAKGIFDEFERLVRDPDGGAHG